MASLDDTLPPGPDWIGRRFADLERELRELRAASSSRVLVGTGSPEGVVAAGIGGLYVDRAGSAGTTLWVKEADDGLATGWEPK